MSYVVCPECGGDKDCLLCGGDGFIDAELAERLARLLTNQYADQAEFIVAHPLPPPADCPF